jgi:hypothetical protein
VIALVVVSGLNQLGVMANPDCCYGFCNTFGRATQTGASSGLGQPPALPAEQSGESGQHSAADRGVPRPRHRAAQHRQVVTEDGDLDVFLVR